MLQRAVTKAAAAKEILRNSWIHNLLELSCILCTATADLIHPCAGTCLWGVRSHT